MIEKINVYIVSHDILTVKQFLQRYNMGVCFTTSQWFSNINVYSSSLGDTNNMVGYVKQFNLMYAAVHSVNVTIANTLVC